MHVFLDITKADQRIVEGIASTETIDSQPGVWEGHTYAGDVIDSGAIEEALPDYLKWSNIREMHANSAVGTAISAAVVDGKLRLIVKVEDDDAWHKVKTRVYKGFSVGGRMVEAVLEKLADGTYIRRILKLILTEISLVDRPANPDAKILLFKMEGPMPKDKEEQEQPAPSLSADQITALQKLAGNLATLQPETLIKAASDPAKIVSLIQAARNDLELAGDMQGASLMTQAIALIQQAVGDAETTEEEPPADSEETPPEAAFAASAKTGNFKKAGRVFNAANLAAMENTVKTLLQMMAAAGSTKAQKAIGAMTDDADDATMAAAIGAEFTKAVTPIAQAVLSLHSDVEALKRQPVAGGPVLRPALAKQISGQAPPVETKPAMPAIIKAQLADLLRKAHTDPNPSFRQAYQAQHDTLRSQYQ